MRDLGMAPLPFELQAALDQEIRKEERLVWSCQPSVNRAVRKALAVLPVALIWLGISFTIAFVLVQNMREGKDVPWFALAIIGLFVLFGVLMASAPCWAAKKAKNIVYAITDAKALILTKKGASIEIESFGPERLRNVDKRLFSDGSGDLIFERKITHHHSSKGRTRESVKEIGFFGIPQVAQVADMIHTMRQEP